MENTFKNVAVGLVVTTGLLVGGAYVYKNYVAVPPSQPSPKGAGISSNNEVPNDSRPTRPKRRNSSVDLHCDFSSPRVIKHQEGGLWCGYAVTEGLLRLNGKDVTQRSLVDSILGLTGDAQRANVGNLEGDEIVRLINHNGLNVRDVSVASAGFEHELIDTLKSCEYAIVGKGGHWRIVQLNPDSDCPQKILVHDPLHSKCVGGEMIPLKFTLNEFSATYNTDRSANWSIISISNVNERICKNANGDVILYTVNGVDVLNQD